MDFKTTVDIQKEILKEIENVEAGLEDGSLTKNSLYTDLINARNDYYNSLFRFSVTRNMDPVLEKEIVLEIIDCVSALFPWNKRLFWED